MAKWRAAALERLPELRDAIASADTIMALWIEIYEAFETAYRSEPIDDSLIGRIYAFADWCLEAPRVEEAGRDPCSAVVVSFYEDIPAFKPARDDMPRWFTLQEVARNRQIFAYHIGDEAYDELVSYMTKNQKRYQPRPSRDGGVR